MRVLHIFFFISLILSIVFINFHRNYLEFDLTIGKLEYVIKNEQWQNNSIINKAEEYLTGTRDTDERLIIEGALEIVKGNNEEGIADIKKAIKASNKNTRVKIFGYMILADVSFNNGDYDEGLQYTYKNFNHIDKRYYSRYYNEILSMYNYPNKNKIKNDILINISKIILSEVSNCDYEARINLQDYLKALYYEENDYVRAVEYIFKNIYLAYDIKNEDLQLKYIEEINQISKNVNNKEIVLNNENYLKLLIEDIEKEEQLSKQFNQNSFLFKAIGIILLIFLVVLCILVIYIRIIKKRIKYDPLTKIYNRGYFDKRYYELLNRKNKFSVIMIDIDNFKKLNDTYGHKFGDTVLVNCCNVMSNLHSGEFELFRYVGEEIVVLLKDKSKKEVIMIAESIRRIIEDLIWEEEVKVTASLGIAYSEECGYKTLEIADKNLYKAKNSGKNRVVFN